MPNHVGIEMAALAGVDLDRRRAGGADAFGILAGLLVAFDHGHRRLALEHLDGLAQQRGFARTGAGNQVQRKDATFGESFAVLLRIGVVLGQDVLLDLHHALLADAGGVGVHRRITVLVIVAGAVAMVVVMVMDMVAIVAMAVTVSRAIGMDVLVTVFVVLAVMVVMAVDLDVAGAAAACRTHIDSPSGYFKFLDPHFGTARDLHLVAAALRAFAEHFLHRHRLGTLHAPAGARRGNDLQPRAVGNAVPDHGVETEFHGLDLDARKLADFQPDCRYPGKFLGACSILDELQHTLGQ